MTIAMLLSNTLDAHARNKALQGAISILAGIAATGRRAVNDSSSKYIDLSGAQRHPQDASPCVAAGSAYGVPISSSPAARFGRTGSDGGLEQCGHR